MPQPAPVGSCSVCGATVKLVSSGAAYRHWHGHGRPACLGSGQPPRAPLVDILDASADLFEADTSANGSSPAVTFGLRPPGRSTLRRVPQGARQRAAQALRARLQALLAAPEDLDRWREALQFADCLAQPPRGGKRHNLTTQIVTQIDRTARGIGPALDDSQAPDSGGNAQQKRKVRDEQDGAVRRASAKLQEGDIRGAVRCLCSEETLAPPTSATHQVLLSKHPAAPADRRSCPSTATQPMTVTAADVKLAVQSFAPGSAGGRDGLRPQHLKDLVNERVGGDLAEVLADFSNLVLRGGVPEVVRPVFFGASLLPFTKKEGGIRPIAVGLTLRRLVSKMANTRALESCGGVLGQTQLGVGTKGGAEALVHAARRYLMSMDGTRAFVKLDFTNAFNSIRRDVVMEAVAKHRPDLLAYVSSAYGAPSQLWMPELQILSAEGVQQGDPLGPLLFCLALDKPLKDTRAEFMSGYLDDVGLGDTVPRLIEQVRRLESAAMEIGLRLNQAKCEVFGISAATRAAWLASGLGFVTRPLEEATLLGSPIHTCGVDPALVARRVQLEGVLPRLLKMAAHEAFFLLRSCFAIPRLVYLLRTSPCSTSAETTHLDEVIKSALSSLLNVKLGEETWAQASLPVRWGGIGVRSTVDLAPSAFLSSMHAASSLMQLLLPTWAQLAPTRRSMWR